MRTLYIVGNGFDLFHSLPTSYKDFRNYLSKLRDTHELMYSLKTYFDGEIWSDFETAFGEFNIKKFLYHNEGLLPDVNSERDGEKYRLPDFAETVFGKLVIGLYNNLNDWVVGVNKSSIKGELLPIDKSAFFLSFNYTDTLKRIYNIPENNILYLHGKARKRSDYKSHPDYFFEPEMKDTDIVFGHAFNPLTNNTINSNKLGLSALVEEDAIEKLIPFFKETFKDTAYIINKNISFFDTCTLAQFDKIIIIGHSFSDIDLPYFIEIANKATNVREIIITYHKEGELRGIEKKASIFNGKKSFITLEYEDDIARLK